MAETVQFTPRKPRTRRPRMTEEARQKISESKAGVPKSDITKARMSEGRRLLFVRANCPLEPGEIIISWITRGLGRRHAIAVEEGTMELSRDGERWFEVTNLSDSMDKAEAHDKSVREG